jgi:hypothetical protein
MKLMSRYMSLRGRAEDLMFSRVSVSRSYYEISDAWAEPLIMLTLLGWV